MIERIMTKRITAERRFMQKIRLFTITIILTLLFITVTNVKAEGDTVNKPDGNLIKITTGEDFGGGTLTNADIDNTVGNGAIKLSAGAADGEYLSDIYEIAPFECMVASWDCDAPEGTYIEVQAKAYCDAADTWTDWLSWGQWSFYMQRSSADTRDKLAYVDTDVLTIRGDDGETASKVQFRVLLHTDDTSVTPVVRQIAATYKNSLEGQEIKPIYTEETVELPEKVILDTPAYSQMTRDLDISSSICSPTTITTLLNDRGEDLLPEEVALNTYDFQYQGFGNWAFSVATAGGFGYEAYVQYADMDILYQELAKGYSVGISVHYTNKEVGSEPYIEGAPITTYGHLITVRGYETIDGVDYIYVSDSAAKQDKDCLLRYKADQLEAAWNGIAYIVHDKEQNAGQNAIQHYAGELRKVEGKEDEYELYVDGEKIEINSKFVSKKKSDSGCGTLAYINSDAVPAMATEPTITTMANSEFGYKGSVSSEGNVRLKPDSVIADAADGESRDLTVYLITNAGKVYIAPVTITKAVPTEPAVTVTQAPAAEPVNAEAQAPKESTPPWIFVGIGAVVIVLAVVLVCIGKKNKNK